MKNIIEKLFNILKASPAKLFFIGYLLVILIGGALLSLPISSADGSFTNYIDTVFTATSAVCVTGLVTLVTATHWTIFGKIVIITLIQLGGLGIITVAGAIGLIINKRFTVKDRMYLAEEKNTLNMQGLVKFLKYVIIATFTIEGIGALLLSIKFIPEYGLATGIGYSIFHAISAFCNAGFDIIGEYSLMPYQGNALVMLTISALIILSGLGFMVYKDVLTFRKSRRLKLHTKIVLSYTLALLIVPTILFLILEWSNPETLANLSVKGKVLGAFFQSVTSRTAGFFSIDQAGIKDGSYLMTILLMFIGGAPAGTAGGFKITTLAVLILAARANLKNSDQIYVFHRRIPKDIVEKALTLFIVSLVWILSVVLILTITEQNMTITDLVYETISAYGTVGLTRGITPQLSQIGKIVIAFTMLFGKLGPITMVYALTKTSKKKSYKEAEERILVG